MDVNSSGRISSGDLHSSLDCLNLDPEAVLPPGLSMRIAYRMLMESDGFIHKGTRKRPKFVAYIP